MLSAVLGPGHGKVNAATCRQIWEMLSISDSTPHTLEGSRLHKDPSDQVSRSLRSAVLTLVRYHRVRTSRKAVSSARKLTLELRYIQVLSRCVDFFIHNGQFDKAVGLCTRSRRYLQAIELCVTHKVGNRRATGKGVGASCTLVFLNTLLCMRKPTHENTAENHMRLK